MNGCVDAIQAGAWVLATGVVGAVVLEALAGAVGRVWLAAFVSQYSGRGSAK